MGVKFATFPRSWQMKKVTKYNLKLSEYHQNIIWNDQNFKQKMFTSDEWKVSKGQINLSIWIVTRFHCSGWWFCEQLKHWEKIRNVEWVIRSPIDWGYVGEHTGSYSDDRKPDAHLCLDSQQLYIPGGKVARNWCILWWV